jgi:hypothetical protein
MSSGGSAYPALPQSPNILQIAAGGMMISDEQTEDYRARTQVHIDDAEKRFRAALHNMPATYLGFPASLKSCRRVVWCNRRAADLIITNPIGQSGSSDEPRLT